jgi:hypothetical protein
MKKEKMAMIREIREEDKQLYMDLTEEFYNSEAVLHPIPEAYREATFHEMMRSQDYVKQVECLWDSRKDRWETQK